MNPQQARQASTGITAPGCDPSFTCTGDSCTRIADYSKAATWSFTITGTAYGASLAGTAAENALFAKYICACRVDSFTGGVLRTVLSGGISSSSEVQLEGSRISSLQIQFLSKVCSFDFVPTFF